MKRYTGRPFPPYRHEPGKTPHPERHPEGHMHGREPVPQGDDFLYGVDLFNAGYFWEAHVYWERLWKEAVGDRKTFLQALIQLSAGFVQDRKGNAVGRDKLLAKAASKLRQLPEAVYEGVELERILTSIEAGRSAEIEVST